MKPKYLTLALVVTLLLTLVNLSILAINYRNSRKTVVIDIVRVFNEFGLKKDLEHRVAMKLNELSSEADSLKAVYLAMQQQRKDPIQLAAMAADVDTAESRLQRAYVISDKNINEQVWQRLNSLLTEYGNQYDYSLVIGANGMGTVLFNRSELDKTEELIKFINRKYETGR